MQSRAALGLTIFAMGLALFLISKTQARLRTPEEISAQGNHLSGQSSAYLSDHAHNPVDWYPWGDAALAKARRENKPIFLSVGYAACHWCHVMERESFQDHETAKILNSKFIPILVDREERPDLDHLYMQYLIQMSGTGGWPMNMFLTPELKPFYGGSYFPKTTRYGVPPFKKVLAEAADKWESDERTLRKKGANYFDGITAPNLSALKEEPSFQEFKERGKALINNCLTSFYKKYDHEFGGFGGDRKFPNTGVMNLFMRAYQKDYFKEAEGRKKCFQVFKFTLEQIANGGIHDHIGGGFHRFSADWRWQVPHFEKMLIDNAMLAATYSLASTLTDRNYFLASARDAADFMLSDLRSKEGAFCTSMDADTADGEGSYYAYDLKDLRTALPEADVQWLGKVLNIGELPNFEGKNIPRLSATPEMVAKEQNISVIEFENRFSRLKEKLKKLREQRKKPKRDEIILCSANGMAITGLSKVYAASGDPKYLDAAKLAANFILTKLKVKNELKHSYFEMRTSSAGFLDDYAFATQAFLDLAEIDSNPQWLNAASQSADKLIEKYWNKESKRFTYSKSIDLPKAIDDDFDQATPSSVAASILSLLRLELLSGNTHYGDVARSTLSSMQEDIAAHISSSPSLLCDWDFAISPALDIVMVANKAAAQDCRDMTQSINQVFLPQKAVAFLDQSKEKEYPPAVAIGKTSLDGRVSAYVCQGASCKSAQVDPKLVLESLKALSIKYKSE